MQAKGIGIDLTDSRRFRTAMKKGAAFMRSVFSARERRYCLSYADAASHFAGTFAAKEAVQKTLERPRSLGDIEIRRTKAGKPEVWMDGKRAKKILLSISHEGSFACAIAIRY